MRITYYRKSSQVKSVMLTDAGSQQLTDT